MMLACLLALCYFFGVGKPNNETHYLSMYVCNDYDHSISILLFKEMQKAERSLLLPLLPLPRRVPCVACVCVCEADSFDPNVLE